LFFWRNVYEHEKYQDRKSRKECVIKDDYELNKEVGNKDCKNEEIAKELQQERQLHGKIYSLIPSFWISASYTRELTVVWYFCDIVMIELKTSSDEKEPQLFILNDHLDREYKNRYENSSIQPTSKQLICQ
jgi:hypothetical protein